MDIHMPKMDGIQATTIIRNKTKPYSQIPILALTASTLVEEKNKVFEAGMNDFIQKPFNPKVLFSKIKNWLTYTN